MRRREADIAAATVPLSQSLGRGTVGQSEKPEKPDPWTLVYEVIRRNAEARAETERATRRGAEPRASQVSQLSHRPGSPGVGRRDSPAETSSDAERTRLLNHALADFACLAESAGLGWIEARDWTRANAPEAEAAIADAWEALSAAWLRERDRGERGAFPEAVGRWRAAVRDAYGLARRALREG